MAAQLAAVFKSSLLLCFSQTLETSPFRNEFLHVGFAGRKEDGPQSLSPVRRLKSRHTELSTVAQTAGLAAQGRRKIRPALQCLPRHKQATPVGPLRPPQQGCASCDLSDKEPRERGSPGTDLLPCSATQSQPFPEVWP